MNKTLLNRAGLPLALGVMATVAVTGCAKSPDLLDAVPTAGATTSAPSASATPTPQVSYSTFDPTERASSATPSETPSPSQTPTAETTPSQATPTQTTPSVTPTPTPTPRPPALMSKGDRGEKVRELHARLRQIDWWSGKVRESYSADTVEAVSGFQTKRGLPPTGEVDQTTWNKLVAMTKAPTHDELYNILRPGPALFSDGDQGDEVRKIQVRLKELAWYSPKIDGVYGPATVAAVKGFQGKREIPVTGEVDRRTLNLLVSMTATPTAEQMKNLPPKQEPKPKVVLDPRCMTGRAVCIDKDTRKLHWVVNGTVQRTMSVRFGSVATPTREGAFTLYWKSRDHVSTLYQSKMPFALFFSGGQAVHYSSDFAARGYAGASHGCVNVRDREGVEWLFNQTKVGDKVIVYRS